MTANTAPTFAITDGITIVEFESMNDNAGRGLAIAPDGTILVAGSYGDDFGLYRYTSSGLLDLSFGGGDGRVITDTTGSSDFAYGLRVGADGKIILSGMSFVNTNAGGTFAGAILRYTTGGTLDTSFSGNGVLLGTETATSSFGYIQTVLPDGKILVAGPAWNGTDTDYGLVRLNANGTVDTSFGGGDGEIIFSITPGLYEGPQGIAVAPDGSIWLAGIGQTAPFEPTTLGIAHITASGALDTSFSGDGLLADPALGMPQGNHTMAVQADGKLLIATTIAGAGGQTDIAVLRYTTAGALDTSFGGGDGIASSGLSGFEGGEALAVLADGSILVAGYVDPDNSGDGDVAVVKFDASGNLDTGFGSGSGAAIIDIVPDASIEGASDIAVDASGRIVVTGEIRSYGTLANAFLLRLNSDGSLDTTFGSRDSLGGTETYAQGTAPIVLDSNAAIHDAELSAAGSYGGASLTLARAGGAVATDQFGASGTLVFDAGSVIVSGDTIGTFTNAGGVLSIVFGAGATEARVNEALRSITYASTSPAPGFNVSHEIRWTFTDGNMGGQGTGGALTATGSTLVYYQPNPSAPSAVEDFFALTEGSGDASGKTVYGNVFANNGGGADSDPLGDPFTITHVNGIAVGPGTTALTLAKGGTVTLTAETGALALYLGDFYDYLPAGQTVIETFDYTITDDDGFSATAPVRFEITGIDSDDIFVGTAFNDFISAGIGNDLVTSLGGNDTVRGGSGNDRIDGGAGRDFLYGDTGNDVLAGGLQKDLLWGGRGADDFVFTSLLDSGKTGGKRDVISDFKVRQDDIDLRLLDAHSKKAGDQKFKFIGAQDFHKKAGELHYKDTGRHVIVEGDVNGDGRADFSILVQNVAALSKGDFIL